MKQYDVAAYVYPAYTGDEMRARIFWPEGFGEWEAVKNIHNILPYKEKGYTWDRKPLWGYVNEANPDIMEMEIEVAVSHGVNVFIYDWYWFDNRPFLENCLNDGFLKAKNHDKMKFYLMWANHDFNMVTDIRNSHLDTVLWDGKVNFQQFKTIGKRWIEKYFGLSCYYCIEGKPVLSIFDVPNFVNGLGGVRQAKEALSWLEEEAKKAGFPGVHVQMIGWGFCRRNLSGVEGSVLEMSATEAMNALGFDSYTYYQYVNFVDVGKDFEELRADVLQGWEDARASIEKEFFPHVSVGWDNNPRFVRYVGHGAQNNGPEVFEKTLKEAKAYADAHNKTPLITINSWNEWTETSYLLPDNVYGYGYLEAVKRVFGNQE